MANIHHVFVLVSATAFRLEDVAGDLVVGPPLATLDMFIDGIHLDVTVSYMADSAPAGISLGVIKALTGWTDEVCAFVGNRVPVPLEELNDDLWGEGLRVITCFGMLWIRTFSRILPRRWCSRREGK